MWTVLLSLAAAADCTPALSGTTSSGPTIYVDKSERSLGYYVGGKLAQTASGPACFPISLGFDPVGTKVQRGDGKTPEGTYHITHRNPASRFHLSLGLSYPGPADARAGYAAGRIDAATRDRILATTTGVPPQDTALGGEIFIHGGGTGSDWTLGCIALADEHIDWLFAAAGPGTVVVIAP